MECDDCKQDKEDVSECSCPFAEEIYGQSIECKLCKSCYHERGMDI